ncbi:hypothetical protein JHK87_003408 [Glycine soja]|nr:hypothetical protein JHK87_003408 [Glycine soja]
MASRSRKSKRKLEPEPHPLVITKKLRQKLPRRRRQNISPVLLVGISAQNPRFSVDSSSVSDFAVGEASCNSSRASVAGKGNINSRNEFSTDSTRNRRFEKRNENEVEVSESSCVDSASFASERNRSLILKFKREDKNLNENDDVSEACTKSEITTVLKFKSGSETKNAKEDDDVWCAKSEITCSEEQFNSNSKSSGNGNGNIKVSSDSNANDFVSFSSGVRASSFHEEANRNKENTKNRASESEYSEVSRSLHVEENCADLIAQSMTKEDSDVYDVVADLACSEDLRFSYCNDDDDDNESEYCSSQGTVLSEFHSELFGECSQNELSDYCPSSLFVDSGSQFSEGSVGETPSPTHLLFLQYSKEFAELVSAPPLKNASNVEDVVNVDLDDEDSYQMLRKRERRQGYVLNYGDGYFSTTEFGDTVIEQRAQMVHWIIEQSCRRQLRQETLFLGVNLLDRFLSKGYFKAKRNLLIVGIACLTLATRIEENQQYNRVGQKNFYIGSNVYSRSEVVAMEWVVQEVLKFQCFLPTIYNFLWYYLKAANADAVVEKRVKYLAVLALSGHEQLCYWPSTVAAALVILACLEFNQISSHKVIGIHVRSKDENLYECIESLEWVLRFPG